MSARNKNSEAAVAARAERDEWVDRRVRELVGAGEPMGVALVERAKKDAKADGVYTRAYYRVYNGSRREAVFTCPCCGYSAAEE